jgi:hypothetical protein
MDRSLGSIDFRSSALGLGAMRPPVLNNVHMIS